MVKSFLSHTFHWSGRTCRTPASSIETLFLVDFFSNRARAKSCAFEKNKATGQTSCIHSLHCEEVNSVLTKMTIMELVYLNISLLPVYREEYNICFWLTLFIKIFSHREKRRRISVDKNTEFYTDDVLSSLNSILQIYTRVKKNTKK